MHGLLWRLTENSMVTTTMYGPLVMCQPCAFIFNLYKIYELDKSAVLGGCLTESH